MSTPGVIVIGGGVAGSAAALRAAQYGIPLVWIQGDRKTAKASRGRWVVNIDNMIGVHPDVVLDQLDLPGERPHLHIGTQDLVANVRSRLREYGDRVTEVEAAAVAARRGDSGFEVELSDGTTHRAPYLVLATGVMDRQPSIARQRGDEVRDMPNWIYPFANRETVLYCIRCEGHLTRESRVGVIGSTETAAQVALMLAERYGSATALLANGETPSFDARTGRLLEHHGIAVHTGRLVDVEHAPDAPKGTLRALVLDDGTRLELHFALVSLGLYRVYNDLARELGAELGPAAEEQLRHVRVDARGETSIPDLFAIGDLAQRADEPIMKQVYTAQEYAVRAVDTVDRRRRRAARAAILGEDA